MTREEQRDGKGLKHLKKTVENRLTFDMPGHAIQTRQYGRGQEVNKHDKLKPMLEVHGQSGG